MASPQCFRVNSPAVIQETIDDEVIIANLNEGFYYSIDELGAAIWNATVVGATVAEIVKSLQARFDFGHDQVERDVGSFFVELERENLLVPTEAPGDVEAVRAALGEVATWAEYEKPVLRKYTDMQHLLLLDPIHEVA